MVNAKQGKNAVDATRQPETRVLEALLESLCKTTRNGKNKKQLNKVVDEDQQRATLEQAMTSVTTQSWFLMCLQDHVSIN